MSDSEDSAHSNQQPISSSNGVAAPSRKKPFWAPKHIIYAKGFPFSAKTEEIQNFFCHCGVISSLTEVLDDKGKWSGKVKIRFATEGDMNKAIALNGEIWYGKLIIFRIVYITNQLLNI
jgi:RNA recognition motif-containing protein